MSVGVIGFPTNVVFLIVMTMVATATGTWLVISQGLRESASRIGRIWRWGAAVVLAAWLILLIALAATSPGGTPLGAVFPVMSLLVGISLGLLPLLLSPAFRRAVRSIPKVYVIGLHAIRVMGVLFLALADMKLLPPQFALPAGYGDVTVGLLALAMVYLLATQRPYTLILGIAWNLLGLLDFVTALGTGLVFIRPFANGLVAQGVSVLYLNYVFLIPAFAVPLYTVLHIYSLYQMISTWSHETEPSASRSVQVPALSN